LHFRLKEPFSADFAATHTSNDQNSSTKSIFAEGTYYVNDKLTIKAGVRVSDDEKDVKSIQGMSSSATPGGLGREKLYFSSTSAWCF
jgi:outer membrane receptor protein involved in Fe transport